MLCTNLSEADVIAEHSAGDTVEGQVELDGELLRFQCRDKSNEGFRTQVASDEAQPKHRRFQRREPPRQFLRQLVRNPHLKSGP